MAIYNPRLSFKALSPQVKSTTTIVKPSETKTYSPDQALIKPSIENLKASFMPSFLGKNEILIQKLIKAINSPDTPKHQLSFQPNTDYIQIKLEFTHKDESFNITFNADSNTTKGLRIQSEGTVVIKNTKTNKEETHILPNKELMEFLQAVTVFN